MTFSIVARVGDAYGVAVASKFIAVGSVVPRARLGVGAIATQAMAKVSYAADGLELLAAGLTATDTVARLTAADEGRDNRQLGVVGVSNQSTFTGPACMDWAGGVTGGDADSGYAIQGNILVGEQVVLGMEQAWLDHPSLPLAARLMQALVAGDNAGGDRRGRQSAALYAVAPGAGSGPCGVIAGLRIAHHPDAPPARAAPSDPPRPHRRLPRPPLPPAGALPGAQAIPTPGRPRGSFGAPVPFIQHKIVDPASGDDLADGE